MAEADGFPARVERAGHWLARFILAVGALTLAVMLALTLADVFGRYILNAPVNGKTELTRFLMAGLIACALPVVSVTGEHIAVDLLDRFFSRRGAIVRDIVVDVVAAVSMLVMGEWLLFRADRLMSRGYVSDFLNLPLHPIAYFIAVMVFVSAVALIAKLVLDCVYLAKPELRSDRRAVDPETLV